MHNLHNLWKKETKKSFFGHYFEFGQLDWLDIAYDDRNICFSPFGNITRSWRIIQKSQKCVPKRKFSAIMLSLVRWIDLILHMMIEQYDFHHSATLPVHDGSFKSPKKAFLKDPKCQKWGFLNLWIFDSSNL